MKGFDTSIKLNYNTAKMLKNAGYDFCIRYLSLNGIDKNDLDTQEINDIINAGLKLCAVQHVLNSGWIPTNELAKKFAYNAIQHAKTIGLPSCNIFLDLEGIKPGINQNDIINYANTWYDIINQNGYVPGIYVGYNTYLNGYELYYKLKFKNYWKSASNVPDITQRGYQIIQTSVNKVVNGIYIDEDICMPDKMNNIPLFIEPKTSQKSITKKILFELYNDGSYNISEVK